MPSKSKRNRRATPQKRREDASPTTFNTNTAAPITGVQSQKFTASYGSVSRGSATAPAGYAYFIKDLKWIGVVAGIIIVLLIISYLFFH